MSTAKKETLALIEELFKENSKGYVTYEKLIKFFDKNPTGTIAKKLEILAKTYKVKLITAAEIAKLKNL